MQKGTATYVAPFGDNKVVEMGGVTFTDGKAVEINSFDHPTLISRLQGNPHFDVTLGKEDDVPKPKAKRGRPSAADIAAAKLASAQADKDAKDAKDRADAAKKVLEGVPEAGKPAKSGPLTGSPPTSIFAPAKP